jgi:transcription-repair coupling factor (superfamily II helicase)
VGRSSNRAYAYLLYDPARPMSPEAQERLEAIQEATELGAGFRLALRDLEIRGAGNLLGAEQHGHMELVGFELYTRMLGQAVELARGKEPPRELPAIKLDLPFDAHLPADYVPDPDLRLNLYQRLAQPASPHEIADLERELIDRFGPLPEPTQNLLQVLRIKSQAVELGIDSIGVVEGELVLRPAPTRALDARALQRIGRGAVRLTPSTVRLDLRRLGDGWLEALMQALRLIEEAKERALALAG